MGYDGTLKFNTEILEKGFSAGVKKLGSVAKTGLTVVGGAVAGVATAFGVMTKKALDSYASLEQNIGGVETLFKDSSQSVVDNAKKAYKTAGLSANAYMETVTSFSASLLQSLGGDTKKAADYADRAIIDMSDNANKMGTSMELIQNAYQGFAKQNYTMLDNLKLGYGGTKEEMQRLVQDASKMTDVQKELGVTVDGSSLSFGNIVNAISVMQKHMGIVKDAFITFAKLYIFKIDFQFYIIPFPQTHYLLPHFLTLHHKLPLLSLSLFDLQTPSSAIRLRLFVSLCFMFTPIRFSNN